MYTIDSYRTIIWWDLLFANKALFFYKKKIPLKSRLGIIWTLQQVNKLLRSRFLNKAKWAPRTMHAVDVSKRLSITVKWRTGSQRLFHVFIPQTNARRIKFYRRLRSYRRYWSLFGGQRQIVKMVSTNCMTTIIVVSLWKTTILNNKIKSTTTEFVC